MASAPKKKWKSKSRRELELLEMLERLLAKFIRGHSRSNNKHTPLREALEYTVREKSILEKALAGDELAQQFRRTSSPTEAKLTDAPN